MRLAKAVLGILAVHDAKTARLARLKVRAIQKERKMLGLPLRTTNQPTNQPTDLRCPDWNFLNVSTHTIHTVQLDESG